MNEKAHIAEAIAMAGGLSAVAKQAKPKQLTAWAVSKWLHSLPPGRVLFLAEVTGWQKTPHQLCPSMYPNPTDGLPPVFGATRVGVDSESRYGERNGADGARAAEQEAA